MPLCCSGRRLECQPCRLTNHGPGRPLHRCCSARRKPRLHIYTGLVSRSRLHEPLKETMPTLTDLTGVLTSAHGVQCSGLHVIEPLTSVLQHIKKQSSATAGRGRCAAARPPQPCHSSTRRLNVGSGPAGAFPLRSRTACAASTWSSPQRERRAGAVRGAGCCGSEHRPVVVLRGMPRGAAVRRPRHCSAEAIAGQISGHSCLIC